MSLTLPILDNSTEVKARQNVTPLDCFRVEGKPHYFSRSILGIRQYLQSKEYSFDEAERLILEWIFESKLISTYTNDNHYRLSDEILKREKLELYG